MTAPVLHAIITLALLGAYTALSITGHDGSPLIGALGGYAGGAAVQKANGEHHVKPPSP